MDFPAHIRAKVEAAVAAAQRVRDAHEILTNENRNYCDSCGNPVYMCYCLDDYLLAVAKQKDSADT